MFQRISNAAGSSLGGLFGRGDQASLLGHDGASRPSPLTSPVLPSSSSSPYRRGSAATVTNNAASTKSRQGSIASTVMLASPSSTATHRTTFSNSPFSPGGAHSPSVLQMADHEPDDEPAHSILVESINTLQSVPANDFAARLVLCSQISALLAEYPATRETFRINGGYLTCISVASSLEVSGPPEGTPEGTLEKGVDKGTAEPGSTNDTLQTSSSTAAHPDMAEKGVDKRTAESNSANDTPQTSPIATTHSHAAQAVQKEASTDIDSTTDPDTFHLRVSLLSSVLTILSRSFEDNLVNRSVFVSTVGFPALYDAINLSSMLKTADSDEARADNDKVLGVLLAFMLDQSNERSAKELWANLRLAANAACHIPTLPQADRQAEGSDTARSGDTAAAKADADMRAIESLREAVISYIASGPTVVIPEVAALMFRFVREPVELASDTFIRRAVILFIDTMIRSSRRNAILFGGCGLLTDVVHWLWPCTAEVMQTTPEQSLLPTPPLTKFEQDVLGSISRSLLLLGLTTQLMWQVALSTIIYAPKPAREDDYNPSRSTSMYRDKSHHSLLRPAALHMPLLKFLLAGVERSRWPSFFHFDYSTSPSSSQKSFEYGAIRVPLANRQFPPFNNNGYSFAAWIHVDRFPSYEAESTSPSIETEDRSIQAPSVQRSYSSTSTGYVGSTPDCAHLHILTIGDADAKQHSIMLYIDYATRTLAMSVMGRTGQDAVSFAQFPQAYVEEGRWIHLAIAHHRGSRSNPSSVSVYLDGERVADHVPLAWPSQTGSKQSKVVVASLGLSFSLSRSLAYPSMYRRKGGPADGGSWSLGPSWLFDGELVDESIYCMYTLGPRYTGNFQDRLGQYQTYASSTAINLRLDALYGGAKHAGDSPLVATIRKPGHLIPENRIYFAINASNTILPGQSKTCLITAGLSETVQNAVEVAMSDMGPIVMNSAIPNPKEASTQTEHLCTFDGNVLHATPLGVDNAFDKTGGVALICRMVELATTSEQLEIAVNLFDSVVRASWRMSEDAERIQAYEVLSMHLRSKKDLITPTVLKTLLHSGGCDTSDATRSVVSNPLAFRFVLLDFHIWNRVEPLIQLLHIEQLTSLLTMSRHRKFNARRLSKMHLVAKMLHAIKSAQVPPATQLPFINCFGIVLASHFRTDEIRQVATYLTASLCSSAVSSGETIASPTSFSAKTGDDSATLDVKPEDSRYQSLMVFHALHDIFFGPEGFTHLAKFATTITTKWMLLFFLDPAMHPLAVTLSLRILARLLRTQSPSYSLRFRNTTDGFRLMRLLLPRWWREKAVTSTLLAMMAGQDVASIPMDAELDTLALADRFKMTENASHIIQTVLACLRDGIRALEAWPSEATKPIPYLSAIVKCLLGMSARSAEFMSNLQSHFADITKLVISLGQCVELHQSSPGPFPLVSAITGWKYQIVSDAPSNNGLQIVGTEGQPLAAESHHDHVHSYHQAHIGVQDQAFYGLSDMLLDVLSLRSATHSDAVLAILATTITPDLQTEVAFRSTLLSKILFHLQQEPMQSWSRKTIDMITQIVDQIYTGLIQDSDLLRALLLTHLEECTSDEGLKASSMHGVTDLHALLNRLTLFALSSDTISIQRIAPMLRGFIHHQLTVFSPSNADQHFFRCLTFRLCALLAGSDPSADVYEREVVIDVSRKILAVCMPILRAPFQFFKLLLLQRAEVFDVAKEPETVIQRLLQAEKDEFVFVLLSDVKLMDPLRASWQSYIDRETQAATQALRKDSMSRRMLKNVEKLKEEQTSRILANHSVKSCGWAALVNSVETTRFQASRQDWMDHNSYMTSEWSKLRIDLLRALRPQDLAEDEIWSLDPTEGPGKIRKKLTASIRERALPQPNKHRSDRSRTFGITRQSSLFVGLPPDDSPVPCSPSTPNNEEGGIWGDLGETPAASSSVVGRPRGISEVNNVTEPKLEDAEEEDKNRKVLRCLDPGDNVEGVFNSSRIIGLSAKGGLLLLGTFCIYIIDGFQQSKDGEVMDVEDIPPDERDTYLETIADLSKLTTRTRTVVPTKDDRHRSRKWAYSDIASIAERKFVFRDVALEITFVDGRSYLMVFAPGVRAEILQALAPKLPMAVAQNAAVYTGSDGRIPIALARLSEQGELRKITRRWENREISNFEYLMAVNSFSGRTYNDVTAYPVFPWILADWESEELDLTKPESFRILSLPMGAQTPDRRLEFEERYNALSEYNAGIAPAHYLTHFSSAMIVSGFLIRLRPFTDTFLDLQGGAFDHADRTFYSWPGAWQSASKLSRSDVRELVPEVFSVHDFLTNSKNRFELGVLQGTNTTIDDVILPLWAHDSPHYFVSKHREALESEFSVDDCNVYQSLSYDGAIDLDKIENPEEKAAATATIHSFGQTPRQIFKNAHPARKALSLQPWELGPNGSLEAHHVRFLVQSALPALTIADEVQTIVIPSRVSSKWTAMGSRNLQVENDSSKQLSYGYTDGSLRMLTTTGIYITEGLDCEKLTGAAYAGPSHLVTASSSGIVMLWKVVGTNIDFHLQQVQSLRGHTAQVTVIQASRLWSIIASGDSSGCAIIWDLNRMRSVHRLAHSKAVDSICINESTGDILIACHTEVYLWTINGELLIRQTLHDAVTACAFTVHDVSSLLLTGHNNSKICIWRIDFRQASKTSPEYGLTLLRVLQQHFQFDARQIAPETRITCLAVKRSGVFVGDSIGRVGLWSLPGTDLYIDDSTSNVCLACNTRFGLLEKRVHCASCSIIVCTRESCSSAAPPIPGKFCLECVDALNNALNENHAIIT